MNRNHHIYSCRCVLIHQPTTRRDTNHGQSC